MACITSAWSSRKLALNALMFSKGETSLSHWTLCKTRNPMSKSNICYTKQDVAIQQSTVEYYIAQWLAYQSLFAIIIRISYLELNTAFITIADTDYYNTTFVAFGRFPRSSSWRALAQFSLQYLSALVDLSVLRYGRVVVILFVVSLEGS